MGAAHNPLQSLITCTETVPRQALARRHCGHPHQGQEHIVLQPGRPTACQASAGWSPGLQSRCSGRVAMPSHLTLESCTSPALWAFLGVNRIIVSRNARRCLVLIDIYSEVRAHCSFWLKAKANSCALVVCRFIRQVRLVPPRKTKPVSKMIKNGRHISK